MKIYRYVNCDRLKEGTWEGRSPEKWEINADANTEKNYSVLMRNK